MIILNEIGNKAHSVCLDFCTHMLTDVKGPLVGAELGIAYGGGVEEIGKLWKGRGTIYGFDTFEGHPKQLAKSKDDFEATCMDLWYKNFPQEMLSYEYQRAQLDKQGLDNVILKKGLINQHSCDDIPDLNYCLLDLDMYTSMVVAYEAIKNKMLPGSYLFFHDVVPATHLPMIHDWFFDVVLVDGRWELVGTNEDNFIAGVRRIK